MCSNFRVKPRDGSVIVGRTMDLGADLKSEPLVFPRNYAYQTLAPNNKPGLIWQGKYGFVGMNGLGEEFSCDGLNEKGLYAGSLYLPGFTQYSEVPAGQEGKALSQIKDVWKWILSNFATVAEVKEAIKDVIVWGMEAPIPGVGVMELHYPVHDAAGNSAVFEFVGGKMQVYDNPLGVLTNSPPFDWQLINLRNYVNLSATNVPELKLDGDDLRPLGEGSGMLGLPGDFTPPSRFVRAVAETQSALPVQDAIKGVVLAFHILDSLEVPLGVARQEIAPGKYYYDYTQWMTVADLKNLEFYVRYYDNLAVLKVDLKVLNFDSEKVVKLNVANIPWSTDITHS